MRIAITGAAGFLGQRLIAALLDQGTITTGDNRSGPIERIDALDTMAIDPIDNRVVPMAGDIADPGAIERLIGHDTDAVFHLAAIVSGQAEEEFDLGMRVNLDAIRLLLERIRAVARGARMVTTSSVAVFGGVLPPVVPDSQVWEPQSSYGMQKAVADLLLSDYSRHGFVDGRSLRMPTVVVRPGRPNRAASSFASGIIREPLAGTEAVCPVSPDTVLWLMSPDQAIANLLHGNALPAAALGGRRVINMPGLSVSVADMLGALRRLAGDAVADRVRIEPDPAVQRIVNSWPGAFSAEHARSLGFTSDKSFDDVIEAYRSAYPAPAGRAVDGR